MELNSLRKESIEESFSITKEPKQASFFGKMGSTIQANGKEIKSMARESGNLSKVMCIWDSGTKEKWKDTEYI